LLVNSGKGGAPSGFTIGLFQENIGEGFLVTSASVGQQSHWIQHDADASSGPLRSSRLQVEPSSSSREVGAERSLQIKLPFGRLPTIMDTFT